MAWPDWPRPHILRQSTALAAYTAYNVLSGHDKMRSGADLRGASPLFSFNHVIDPHFVAFSRSSYTTICNPNPNPNLNSNPDPNPNPNPNRNPNSNPTVITDPQIGPRDPQIVIVLIRPADPLRSAFCRVPVLSLVRCRRS